jgi:ATP-dependent exoDNAse (exonuclease V) beta subunit
MNFVVYKSSAGSGKTYSLVKEYITLALQSPDKYSHLLAVTFTNKAANEMKQRILTNLHQLSDPLANNKTSTIKSMLPELCRLTGQSPELLSANAREILSRILHNYSDFAITTIDSFVNRIIRTFARDLKLPLNFEVELNSGRLLDQAIDKLITRVGNDNLLTEVLLEYTQSMTDSERGWNIEKDLAVFGKLLFDENGMIQIEKLRDLSLDSFSKSEKIMIAFRHEFEKHVTDAAKAAESLILSNSIDNESFSRGKSGIGGYFTHLSNGRMDKLLPNSYVIQTISDDNWCSKKADPAQQQSILAINARLKGYYQEIQDYASGPDLARYKLFGLLVFKLYPLALLSEMEKEIDRIRTENNIVHISEFNHRIAEIVMHEPVPFIYERLGEKFNHYLIDEFQDTSRLQWMNLLPLLENSLASGYCNLVVGDGKQAIYRWRNGCVEQFVNLPRVDNTSGDQLISRREEILTANYSERLLDTNYRSQQGIVNFNNGFFTHAVGILDNSSQRVYDNSRQTAMNNADTGFVNLEFITKDDSGNDSPTQMTSRTLDIVNSLTKDENYNLGEIVVLTRSKADGSLVANALVQEGIPVVSSEALLLNSSPEVKMMIALLRILAEPTDKVSIAEVLHLIWKWQIVKSNDLNDLLSGAFRNNKGHDEKPDVYPAFIDILRQSGIDFSPAALLRMPLYDLCEQLVRIFGINKIPNPYLQFFLDVVHKQFAASGMGLTAFLQFWGEKQSDLSVVVPEQLDAVRVMTIHKAKGLEFPVVIFPFAANDARTSRNYLWIDLDEPMLESMPLGLVKATKELSEAGYDDILKKEAGKTTLDMLNIMYVAMTRPVERLYILTTPPPKSSESISMPVIFRSFLEAQGLWNDEKSVYSFGNREQRALVKEVPKSHALLLNEFISVDWRTKLRLAAKAPELWDTIDPSRNIQWGNLVHTVLSHITVNEQIQTMFEKMKFDGLILPEQEEELKRKVRSVLNHPLLSPLFSNDVEIHSESELLLPDGTSYRPDRVVISKTEAVIVEYKTGKPKLQHRQQVDLYAGVLGQMGYLNVRKLLVYLDDEIHVEEC